MSEIKLWQGDCRELIKKIPDESIDLIIADPPYCTTKEYWDKKEIINIELIKEFWRILKKTGNIYIWCGIGEKSQSLIRWFLCFNKEFIFKDLITWKKQRGIGMRKGWLYTREEIMWFVKDNKQFTWNKEEQYSKEKRALDGFLLNGKKLSERTLSIFKRWTNVWTDINAISFFNSKELKGFRKVHFTIKPLEAIRRIVKLHTYNNDTILDPFMGSGTTGVACKELNRNFIGIELDKDYYKIAQARIDTYNRKVLTNI